MKNYWLTSDWHLNHKNITGPKVSSWKSGYRTFDSIQEMNKEILFQLNKHVQWDDELWFLGDLCFGGHEKTPYWRNQINCQNIYWILGNHDSHAHLYKHMFKFIGDVWQGKIDRYPFFLSHYSHRVWDGSHKGVYHAYGHSHNNLEHIPYGRSMDVGIDAAYQIFGEYRPFNVEQVENILFKRDIVCLDHHNTETNTR